MRALLLWLLLPIATPAAPFTRLKPDERIVFHPTVARRTADGAWQAEVRGCIYEPQRRGVTLAALRAALDLKDVEMTADEKRIFAERARLFLADHERRKKIFIRCGERVFPAGQSGADGRFTKALELSSALRGRQVEYTARLAAGDSRSFRGEIFLLEAEGWSVISDLDDTIKVTEVRDRRATLRNTLLREFQPVPGMAEFYRRLAGERGAQFHYISASPWQLYEPLAEMVERHGFPHGTFDLKEFRWKNRSFLSLFSDPEKYKPAVIEPLLQRFPLRRFLLVGDSGERDPEIYGALARKFPSQIAGIYIRDVTGEAAEAERYVKAFAGVPRERWQVFREPQELLLPAGR